MNKCTHTHTHSLSLSLFTVVFACCAHQSAEHLAPELPQAWAGTEDFYWPGTSMRVSYTGIPQCLPQQLVCLWAGKDPSETFEKYLHPPNEGNGSFCSWKGSVSRRVGW